MKTDNLRNFTVRFPESALQRVESTAKPFYGGRLERSGRQSADSLKNG